MISIRGYVLFLSVLSSSFALKANFHHEDINWSDIKNKAMWVGSLLQTNKALVRQTPTIAKFLQNVATNTGSLLTANPAFTATTIYFTGVLAASYYYAREAESQLLKAQFKGDDIKLIIETEMIPLIEQLEKLLSSGNLDGFCNAKVKDSYRNQLAETGESLQSIRKDINTKIVESSSGAFTNKVLQWVTGTGAAVGVGAAIAAEPCVATAFLACPQVIAGAAGAANAIGFLGFRSNKITHEETVALLNSSWNTVYEAEKTCKLARFKIMNTCTEYAVNMVDINNMMESLDVFMPKKETLKLGHQDEENAKPKYAQINEL